MSPMRIVFMGTPDFAVPSLRAILEAGHEVACVYTQPPRGAGRGMALRKSPIQAAAEAARLTLRTPERLKKAEELERFRALRRRCRGGRRLWADPADADPRGSATRLPSTCMRSLLPRWRGAAPIKRAIMAGDSETGVMDHADGRRPRHRPRLPDRAPSHRSRHDRRRITRRAGQLGADLMVEALAALARGILDFAASSEKTA